MTAIKKKAVTKKAEPSLKDQIIEKLSAAFEHFKEEWGEKKFKRKIKKAGKILHEAAEKKTVKAAKPAKKAVKHKIPAKKAAVVKSAAKKKSAK